MSARRLKRGTPTPPPSIRVAIYTRKSTEEGLDQEFNSLDNQREAVEAYVQSQHGEGWVALPGRYDDGGYTGANTSRPGFQRLMADIEAGTVDVVAVYKIDRLSRSLLDFTVTMQEFEKRGVKFVSVTQNFDTSTSLGRMTLNLLATFSQFEREMISERTRDKIAASRRKGMWVGGPAPLGYLIKDKRLVPDPEHAEQIREMFRIYLETGSLITAAEELNRRGWTTRTGRPWDKVKLRLILTSVVMKGMVPYRDEVHDGVHEAIVDQALWDAVRHRLKQNRGNGGSDQRNKWGALLKGMLRCATCGAGMNHHYTARGDRRYRYYVCGTAQKRGAAACPGSRVTATDIEAFVLDHIRHLGADPEVATAATDAARHELEARKPSLVAEVHRLEADRKRIDHERRGLLAAIPDAGPAVGTLTTRLGEIDGLDARAQERLAEVRAELIGLGSQAIDGTDLCAALAAFDPLWDTLVTRERVRLLRLLIEKIAYDAASGDVAITFRTGGLQALAQRRSA